MRNSKKLALAAAIGIIIAAIFASSLIAGNLGYRYAIHHAMTASRLDGFLHPDGIAEITIDLDGETYVHEVALY